MAQAFCWLFYGIDVFLFSMWRYFFNGGERNRAPVRIQGAEREMIGHTALISDAQLTWIQEFTTKSGDPDQRREARRVLIRAVHIANLLEHGGFVRLHEHAATGYAMNQYFSAAGDNPLIKTMLSKTTDLKVLKDFPSGNKLEGGEKVPRQILWARLVIGSLKGLNNEGRWRGPMAQAIFTVAQQNYESWGRDNVSRTAVHRHVYTVTRRWLIDWMMFIWWEIDIHTAAVNNTDMFFQRMRSLLTSNLMHNTWSLPHAVGEMAISRNRADDLNRMVSLLFGEDWEVWLEQTTTISGIALRQAMEGSNEWTCVGREVDKDVLVARELYDTRLLEDVIATGEHAKLGDQARARMAERIVETLTGRTKEVWLQLPNRLLDPSDTVAPEDEP